jgi:hypothetical protein
MKYVGLVLFVLMSEGNGVEPIALVESATDRFLRIARARKVIHSFVGSTTEPR